MLLSVEDGATVDDNYYLKMLMKHLYVIRRLSCKQKFTIQQYVARSYTANSATNENVLIILERKIGLLIFMTSMCSIIQLKT